MTRLLNSLKLQIDEPLAIECDNWQTIRFMAGVEEMMGGGLTKALNKVVFPTIY